MSHVSENRGRPALTLWRVSALAAFLAATLVVLGMSAGGAKAEPVGYSFDNGVINLGGQEGIWATLIDQSIPDPPATINAEVAGDGTLSAAKEDFFFPLKKIEDLDVTAVGQGVLTFVDATIKISAEGPLTGSFDTTSGESEVIVPADVFVTVYNANSPAALARCRVDGFDLVLKTTAETLSDPGDPEADPPRSAATYDASAFNQSDEGKGAMTATWASLPNAKNEGGALGGEVCPGLDSMLGGPGGAWLDGAAGSDVEPPPPEKPKVAPKLTGTPATSTESNTATFSFTQGDGETIEVTGFTCSIDGAQPEPCDGGSKSYSGLAAGSHTFEVKATNNAGEGPSASFSWQITESCPDGTTGTPPACVKPGKAKLAALKVQPKTKAVKRGKRLVVKVTVRNAGKAAAKGVKVCVNAPAKLVKVKKCVGLGQVAAGKAKTASFKVKTKRKKGKAVLKFTATSSNAGKKTGKATVRVK